MYREELGDFGTPEEKKVPLTYKIKYILASILMCAVGSALTYTVLCENSKRLLIANPVLYIIACIPFYAGLIIKCVGFVRLWSFLFKK